MACAPEQWQLDKRQRDYLARITGSQDIQHTVPWLGRMSLPNGIAHPKIDSLLLAITAEPWVRGDVLDTFCGSGVVGAHLLDRAGSVLFVDVNPACVDFVRNLFAMSTKSSHVRAIVADVYPNEQQTFDVIVANPPYVDTKVETPEDRILFDDHHAGVNRFLTHLAERLTPTGIALMTWSSFADFSLIEILFERFRLDFFVQAELSEPWPADPCLEIVYRVYRLQPSSRESALRSPPAAQLQHRGR